MKEQCHVLGTSLWTMTDEETGEVRTGVTVWYTQGVPVASAKERGVFPMKQSAPVSTWQEFHTVPGVYELEFEPKRAKGMGGREMVTLKLTGASYVGTALPEKAAK